MGELYPVRGLLEHTGPDFREALRALAERLALDPTALAAVMSFETAGDFRTGPHGSGSSATGLIGFMDSTARRLGTTTGELAAMSQVEQLAYVERYYQPIAARVRSVADHYMAVFAPAGVGQGAGFVLYAAPSSAYQANRALDRSGDGTITVGEASAGVEGLCYSAKQKPPIARESAPGAPVGGASGPLGALLLSVLGTWVLMRWRKRGRA